MSMAIVEEDAKPACRFGNSMVAQPLQCMCNACIVVREVEQERDHLRMAAESEAKRGDELKTCPLCGDNPYVSAEVQGYGPRVMCQNHECSMDGSYNVDAWNTRDTSAIEAAVLRKVAGKWHDEAGSIGCRSVYADELIGMADRIEQETE